MGNSQEIGNGKGDIFKQVKGEMAAIEKSRSKSDLRIQNQLQKSASKSRFLDEIRVRRSRAQSAHSMTFEEESKTKEDKDEEQRIQKEIEQQKLIELEEEERLKAEEEEQRKLKEEEDRKRNEKRKTINPYDDAPKKMDDILGPMRGNAKSTVSSVSKAKKKEKTPSPPPKEPSPAYTPSVYTDPDFDPNKKEIKGMSENVQLKKTAKNKKDAPKKEVPESKLSAREKMMANLGKPAKFKKPKPAEKAKEPTPPPTEEKEPSPLPPVDEPKEPSPVVLPKELTPIKEPTPKPKSPLPPPPSEEEYIQECRSPSPTKMLPPKIGINGFNGVGRIVLRSAIESGLDIKAINDPFVPLQYMVYTLKFDLAMSSGGVDDQSKSSRVNKSKKREIYSVRESPTGKLVINGHEISVFVEHDVTKIPWTLAGVNYVVESTDVLSSLAEASLHLSTSKRGVRLRHIIEEEQLRKSQGRESSALSSSSDGEPMALMYGGCKNVIIAGPSDDAPLFCVGINDDMSARGGTLGDGKVSLSQTTVASHVSAPVAALAPILYLINKSFKIKFCSYTLLRSVKGGPKR
jgi:glyceraldehyde-3-phosphate dehydrogenase/erythrose-4-phosphate dehydrogenase